VTFFVHNYHDANIDVCSGPVIAKSLSQGQSVSSVLQLEVQLYIIYAVDLSV
jgi:hypothetical protein